MRKQLTHIAPLRAGVVLAVMYGMISLVVAPLFLLAALFGGKGSGGSAAMGVGFAIALPFLYAAGGFIGGILMAALYNLVTKFTGGFEFELRDSEPTP